MIYKEKNIWFTSLDRPDKSIQIDDWRCEFGFDFDLTVKTSFKIDSQGHLTEHEYPLAQVYLVF